MDLQELIADIGTYTHEAIVIAHADPADGAMLRLAWANPAFEQLTGYGPADIEGETLNLLACAETDPVEHARIIDRLDRWQQVDSEVAVGRRDGSWFWAHLSCNPVADKDGRCQFWITTLRDITSRHEEDDRVHDLSLIAATTKDMAIVMDQNRRITWVNSSFEAHTGFALSEIAGRHLPSILFAPAADQEVLAGLKAGLDRREAVFGEILCRTKSGSVYLGEFEYQPILDDLGFLKRYVSLHRDVTEKRSLELRYSSLINESGLMSYVKDGGRFVLVNAEIARSFGRPEDWFTGRNEQELLEETGFRLFEFDEERVLTTGEPFNGECTLTLPSGERQTHLVHAFRLFDPRLQSHLLCCVANDVTGLKRTEQDLRLKQEEALAAESRLLGAIESMTDGFAFYGRDGRIVICNSAYRDLHGPLAPFIKPGVSYAEILAHGLDHGVWHADGPDREGWIDAAVERRQSELGRERVVEAGAGRWVLLKDVALHNGETVAMRIDISDIKRSEADLKIAQSRAEQAQARLEAAVEAMGDSFMVYDTEDRLVIMNAASEQLTGLLDHKIEVGVTFQSMLREGLRKGLFLDAIGREEEYFQYRLQEFRNPTGPKLVRLANGQHVRLLERKAKTGDTVVLRFDVTTEHQQQLQLEAIAEDLRKSRDLAEQRNRDLEQAKSRIEHASLHDALTELPNRRYLDRFLEGELGQPSRAGRQISALHIDLDRFKQINDTMGHAAGDAVLRHVSAILRGSIRKQDFAARVGGDEFVVLTVGSQTPEQLTTFAERLIARMNEPVMIDGKEVRYGASIGIARAGSTPEDTRSLLVNADMALYNAKELGRNRCAHFSSEMHARMVERTQLAGEILKGLDRGEFIAHYQPQFDARTLELVSVEALVRWQHPDRGLVYPDQFLGVAGDIGVLRRIDRTVLQRVFADRQQWQAAGLTPPRVSVNISSHRLRDHDLVTDIRDAGLPPGALTMELLESIFLDDADTAVQWTIDQLREMGVGVELDDFGTGHASIVGLIRLRPDGFKIDRQFVQPITASPENLTLVRSMIEIGHSLGVRVVAEGVETAEHVRLLADSRCDILQGYHFARPMPAEALVAFTSGEAWKQAG
ncbi:sensor domain-containing protein [Algicella marina]|nr:EAL domain-containing protein [Algicella marina]